jgi:hypothetical protein
MNALIRVSEILADRDIQTRAAMNESTVAEYADAMRDGATFPALIVFREKGKTAAVWLADGFHRLAAAKAAGILGLPCDVRPGGRADALRFALGANATHGLRRTHADIANAIRIAYERRAELGLPDVPSAKLIVDLVGVDHKTATAQLGKFPSWRDATARTGADGRTRSVPPPPPSRPAAPPPPPPASRPIPPPPQSRNAPPPPPEEPEAPAAEGPLDNLNRVIPEAFRPMWNRGAEIDELKAFASKLRVAIRKGRESGDPLYRGMPQEVLTWLDNTYSELDNSKPWAVCPWCGGMAKTCRMCGGPARGFVSEFQWKQHATDELRAVVAKTAVPKAKA